MQMLKKELALLQAELSTQQATPSALACLSTIQESVNALAAQQHALQAELAKLRAEHAFLTASLDMLPNPIFIKNDKGEFIYFNPQYEQYFQIKSSEYLNKTVLDLTYLPKAERERYQAEDLALIQSAGIKHYETTFSLADGSTGHSLYWSSGFVCNETQSHGLVGEFVDISLQKRLQEEIKQSNMNLAAANTRIQQVMKLDTLTGVSNRRVLEELVRNATQEINENACVIMADLDRFKSVNDTFGHAVGDSILIDFAHILQRVSRKEDIVIRYGGEEFLVFLTGTCKAIALQVAERIRSTTEAELARPDGRCVTVSLGVHEYQVHQNLERCIIQTDQALYQAKQTGRNKVVLWDASCDVMEPEINQK